MEMCFGLQSYKNGDEMRGSVNFSDRRPLPASFQASAKVKVKIKMPGWNSKYKVLPLLMLCSSVKVN